ncbi:MAG: hypothetical protein ACM3Y9_04215 [Ignavibacteria bacterium]
MKISRAMMLAACASFATPAHAGASAYDLLVFACDHHACTRVANQKVSGDGTATEYKVDGLRLMIETLVRRADEEEARVSLAVRPAEEGAPNWRATRTSWAQRLETLVVQCTLRNGAFSPLTSFVSGGRTYQIWARLAGAR